MSVTHTEHTESWDTDGIDYLLHISATEFKRKFCSVNSKNEFGEKRWQDVEQYRAQCTHWLNQAQANHGTLDVVYHFAQNKSSGRLFATGASIQHFSREMRPYLIPEAYTDYDLSNCHPNLHLMVYNLMGFDTTYLNEYCKNRSDVLARENIKKQTVLAMMNQDNHSGSQHRYSDWFKEFLKENRLNKNKLQGLLSQWGYSPNPQSRHPLSSTFCGLICDLESLLVEHTIEQVYQNYGQVQLINMFDGFMTNVQLDLQDQLEPLQSVCYISWEEKPWEKPEFEVVSEHNLERENNDYESVKSRFEEKFYIVQEPLLFCYKDKPIPRKDFIDLAETYQFYGKGKNPKPKSIFATWMKDPNKRHYERRDFVPYNPVSGPTVSENIINTAKPMKFQSAEGNSESQAAKDFRRLVEFNTCSPEAADYLLKFFAHMVQKPWENPQVYIIIKGIIGGTGKDTMTIMMSAVIGDEKVFATDKMEYVFGQYNSALSQKVLVQLNEAKGTDAAKYFNNIKHHSTCPENIIRKMYHEPIPETNYVRYVFYSNDFFSHDTERRGGMYNARVHETAFTPEQFDEIYNVKLQDQNYINDLGNYLMSIDLSQCDIKRPYRSVNMEVKALQKVQPIHMVFQRLAQNKFEVDNKNIYQLDKYGENIIGVNRKFLLNEIHFMGDDRRGREAGKFLDNMTNALSQIITKGRWVVSTGKTVLCYKFDQTGVLQFLKNGKYYCTEEEAEEVQFNFST